MRLGLDSRTSSSVFFEIALISRGLEIADGRDAPAADRYVRSHGRCALAVEHRAAGDQKVVRVLRRRTSAGGDEEERYQEVA
jgi:hypothetical protein